MGTCVDLVTRTPYKTPGCAGGCAPAYLGQPYLQDTFGQAPRVRRVCADVPSGTLTNLTILAPGKGNQGAPAVCAKKNVRLPKESESFFGEQVSILGVCAGACAAYVYIYIANRSSG